MNCLLAAAAYGAFKELLASIHGIYEEQLSLACSTPSAFLRGVVMVNLD